MAIAVIVGLSFATVLTLVIVPVLYSLVDDFGKWFSRHYLVDAVAATGAASAMPSSEAARPRRRRVPIEAFQALWTRRARQAED
jgi:hypothetical protein